MRRLVVLLCIGLVVSLSQSADAASKIKPGSICKKVNQQVIYKKKIYTCIKLGKNLYWNNGATYKIEKPIPLATQPAKPIASPTPSQTITSAPPISPLPSQTIAVPLLRDADVTFYSGKLKVVWNGLDTSQKSFTNLRRLNVWLFELQNDQSISGGLWRVACFIAPMPGSFCEISMPPKEYAVKISAYYLSGEESGYSATIRLRANYVSPAPIG